MWIFLNYNHAKTNWDSEKKYAFIKKYTIFTQKLGHFIKMTYSWVGHFDEMS